MPQYHSQQSKNALRQKCKEIRIKLYNEGQLGKISEEITKKISKSKDFTDANHIMLFYPKKYEIDVLGLMNFEKNFYLPRCEGENIAVCKYKKGDPLKQSEFGVFEPNGEPIKDTSILDLVIVPALCADKSGNRLGYGKGFYDRFLKGIKAKTIVVVPKCLVFNSIEQNEFDITCDKVISE